MESDNSTVVAAVKSGSSKDSQVMRLTRVLQFLAAKNSFVISARHVPGKANSVADTLSREKPSDEFLSSVQLRLEPDRLPPELVAMLQIDQSYKIFVAILLKPALSNAPNIKTRLDCIRMYIQGEPCK